MRELSLFSGAGGGLLGTKLLGWEHVGYVEFNEYCQQVITQRIKDGFLDEAPIFSDVRAFVSEGYAESYQGMVDVVTGGFPCQPFSVAGKQQGDQDERDMWPATRDVIRAVQPKECLLENVPNILVFEYFGRILRDLAEMGYFIKWGVISGREAGAVHLRERVWIYASNDWEKRGERKLEKAVYRFTGFPWGEDVRGIEDLRDRPDLPEPIIRRIGHDVAGGMDRLEAIGNGQIPRVAATAWEILSEWH